MGMKTTNVHEAKTLTSNTVSTLQIPAYGKIQSLFLRFTTGAGADNTEAEIRAQVGNIRLTINGRDIVNCTAARLYDLYEVMGPNATVPAGTNGVLELNIGRLVFTDPQVRDLFGFGTADVTSIQVQVTAGTLTTVASVQAFTARQAINENLGTYCRFIDYPQSFNSTGDHTVDTLPREINSDYLAVMASTGASGTITFGECRVNNATVIERTPLNVNAVFLSNDRLAQPSGYYVYHFADGSLFGRLPMQGVTDLRFITTFSVAPGAASYVMSALTVINFPKVG